MSFDPFDRFDEHFDKMFDNPKRTVFKFGVLALVLQALAFVFVVAVIVGAILFLKAHGVF